MSTDLKQTIRTLIKNQVISGSVIIIVGGVVANSVNFLFNLFMARNLSVPDYGILSSMVSLITMFTIPASAITPTVVRFGATYFAKGQLDMVRGLYIKILKFTLVIGAAVLLGFLVFNQQIGGFFRIQDQFLIILAGIIVFFSLIGAANLALLQAKLLFMFISIMNTVSNLLKLLVGVGLVLLGYQVNGALLGFAAAYLTPYFISFIPFRFLFKRSIKSPPISSLELVKYGGPSALALFGLSSFITTDIILVKHFFDPHEAGLYSGLSLIGRVIYFLTAPIAMVMFPIIVQRHTREEDYSNIFKLALALVLIPSVSATLFYFIFPEFTINFFTKGDYQTAGKYLGLFGGFTTIYSLLSVFTNYYLSIKKTLIAIPILIAAIIQAGGIWLFHNSFFQVIMISLITSGMLLLFEGLYYIKLHEEKKTK